MELFKLIEINITDIIVKDRARQDLGDIEGLSATIQDHGLLNPILLTETHELIAGERQQHLGYSSDSLQHS